MILIAQELIIAKKKLNLRASIALILSIPVLNIAFSDQAIGAPAQNIPPQSESAIVFDIPAKSLDAALNNFKTSTGWEVSYPSKLTEGLSSLPIKGSYTAKQALALLLADTGLKTEATGEKSITLVKKDKPTSSIPSKTFAEAPSSKNQPASNKPAISEKKSAKDNSVFELGEMVVTGASSSEKLQSRDVLSSVDIMNADKIADQNVQNAYDLFHRMPGVQITQFGQGITR